MTDRAVDPLPLCNLTIIRSCDQPVDHTGSCGDEASYTDWDARLWRAERDVQLDRADAAEERLALLRSDLTLLAHGWRGSRWPWLRARDLADRLDAVLARDARRDTRRAEQ